MKQITDKKEIANYFTKEEVKVAGDFFIQCGRLLASIVCEMTRGFVDRKLIYCVQHQGYHSFLLE